MSMPMSSDVLYAPLIGQVLDGNREKCNRHWLVM